MIFYSFIKKEKKSPPKNEKTNKQTKNKQNKKKPKKNKKNNKKNGEKLSLLFNTCVKSVNRLTNYLNLYRIDG